MHYYQFNIGDYRRDTAHLSLLEHGIYRQLLDTYYLNEQPLKTQQVMRRLGIKTDEEKSALNNVINDFFITSKCGKYIEHKRVKIEIDKYQRKACISRENGKKGGRPKKQQLTEPKKPRKTQQVILGNPDKTQAKPNQEPITNNQEPVLKKNIKKKAAKFIPPSINEVKAYCAKRKNNIDAEQFVSHYEANGWYRGKTKIKNWKACVVTWEKNHEQNTGSRNETNQRNYQSNTEKVRNKLEEIAKRDIEANGFVEFI